MDHIGVTYDVDPKESRDFFIGNPYPLEICAEAHFVRFFTFKMYLGTYFRLIKNPKPKMELEAWDVTQFPGIPQQEGIVEWEI